MKLAQSQTATKATCPDCKQPQVRLDGLQIDGIEVKRFYACLTCGKGRVYVKLPPEFLERILKEERS